MPLIVVAAGLTVGGLAGFIWLTVAQRSDTRRVFTALGKSLKAMLSEEGAFLREYFGLLGAVLKFAGWNLLAVGAAVAPLLAIIWLWQTELAGYEVLLISVYSVSSLGAVMWLRRSAAMSAPSSDAPGRLSVTDSQFMFLQIAQNIPWLLDRGDALERRLLKKRLQMTTIDRPIFITGLARSGTTMLLELLAQADDVATHRYRDFPFVSTPWLWNQFVKVFGRDSRPTERPHADGIRISPESPEAFEEPLWQRHFADAHQTDRCQMLNETDRDPEFDRLFVEHLRKMLLIRKGKRYVSKGNYNVTRLDYLASLFPDARFVVPVRHPVSHVVSLVRQQQLFLEHARQDPRVPHYMAAAGHYEFGPQRVPINLNDSVESTLEAWADGDESLGYAHQWTAIYGQLLRQRHEAPWQDRVLLVRYEDLCASPASTVRRILQHTALESSESRLMQQLDHIRATSVPTLSDPSQHDTIWNTTAAVAQELGYDRHGPIDGSEF